MEREAASSMPRVNGNLFPTMIEQMHHPRVPPRPDFATEIFRWRRVVGLGHFHVAVATHFAPCFVKAREAIQSQRLQCWTLDFMEQLVDLLLGRAVNPRVGCGPFPVGQEAILLFDVVERAGLEGVVLDVLQSDA